MSILIWLPSPAALDRHASDRPPGHERCGRDSATRRASRARWPSEHPAAAWRWLGARPALALAIGYIADFHSGTPGLQHVTDVVWISRLGIHYKLGVDGLNVFLVG